MIADGEETAEFTGDDGEVSSDAQRFLNTRLAVHPTDPDVLYVGYRYQAAELSGSEAPNGTMVSASTDGGRTWSEPVDPYADLKPDEVYGSDQPGLAVGPDGTVHAFAKERPDADSLDDEQWPRMLQATSTDGGQTWESRIAPEDVAICSPCLTNPESAVDPATGTLYVVFELSESPPPNARDDRDIWVLRSTDGGETFDPRVRLNDGKDPDRDPDNNQLFPGIDIAPNGRVDVVWYDFRSDRLFNPDSAGTADHRGDLRWDVYGTYSTDGGETWAPNVRVSDRSMHREDGYAMHPQHHLGGPLSVASTDDRAHVVWSDSRAGTPDEPAEDVYYTAVVHGEASTGPAVSMGSLALGGAGALAVAGGLLLLAVMLSRGQRPARGE